MAEESSVALFADFDSANMARYERVSRAQTTAESTANNPNNKFASNEPEANNNESVINNERTLQKHDIELNVWTRQDCEDAPTGLNANRTWFYFGVRGGHGKWIRFNMMNLNKQGRLFEMGMLPVFKSVPGHEKWARIYSRPIWQNLDCNFTMSFVHRIPDRRDSVTYFAFCFPFSYHDCQTMLAKYDKQFEHCQNINLEKCDPDEIYYHRELLCYSLDKRRVDLITISACNSIGANREPRFDPDCLFPQHDLNTNNNNNNQKSERCFDFERKRVYVLTSRVHPGETPASFVFNGFLEFILRKDDPRAKLLRKQFVFKLIPMLNPDGVSRGYYRTDQLGTNLNRVYLDPSFQRHPSIYAVKSLIVYHHCHNRISKAHDNLNFDHVFKLNTKTNSAWQEADSNDSDHQYLESVSSFNNHTAKQVETTNLVEHLEIERESMSKKEFQIGNENSDEEVECLLSETALKKNSPHLNDEKLSLVSPMWSGVAFYVDLHGHAAKRGCFIYGNSIDNELYQVENVLFAKLIAFSSPHFDFDGCNFSVRNMFMRDKREGLSKEGSGRVAMFKALGLTHSYTLECSYASGRVLNTIAPAANNPSRAISPAQHSDIPPKFTTEHYADVGKALAIAALDIAEINPHSRIPNTSFGSLESVRNWIKFYIRSKNPSVNLNSASTLINKKSNKPVRQIQGQTKPVLVQKSVKLASSSTRSIMAAETSKKNNFNLDTNLKQTPVEKHKNTQLANIQNRRNFLRTTSVMVDSKKVAESGKSVAQQRFSLGAILFETTKSKETKAENASLKSVSSTPQFSTCSSMSALNFNKPLSNIGKIRESEISDESLSSFSKFERKTSSNNTNSDYSVDYYSPGKVNSTRWYLPDEPPLEKVSLKKTVKKKSEALVKTQRKLNSNRRLLPISKSNVVQSKTSSDYSPINSQSYQLSKLSKSSKLNEQDEELESKICDEQKLAENISIIDLAKNEIEEEEAVGVKENPHSF